MIDLNVIRTGLEGIEHNVRETGTLEKREALALIQAILLILDHLEKCGPPDKRP